MTSTISILTAIGGIFIVLWALLWTYMRWQRIVHNKHSDSVIKKIFWMLAFIGVILLLAALIVFKTQTQ